MEVKANKNVDAAQRLPVSPVKSRAATVGGDTASFNRVEALEQSLATTPAVRTEAVTRARELIGDVKYPPVKAIDGIAALLALKMDVGVDA
ncbi:MAG: hypothetical protein QM813_22115 [Verrucomicrobiota bacterium]